VATVTDAVGNYADGKGTLTVDTAQIVARDKIKNYAITCLINTCTLQPDQIPTLNDYQTLLEVDNLQLIPLDNIPPDDYLNAINNAIANLEANDFPNTILGDAETIDKTKTAMDAILRCSIDSAQCSTLVTQDTLTALKITGTTSEALISEIKKAPGQNNQPGPDEGLNYDSNGVGLDDYQSVDTITEIQNLANKLNALELIKQCAIDSKKCTTLTTQTFDTIGVTGVTNNNLPTIIEAIKALPGTNNIPGNNQGTDPQNGNDDYTDITTIADIQALVSLAKIMQCAIGCSSNPPTAQDYQTVNPQITTDSTTLNRFIENQAGPDTTQGNQDDKQDVNTKDKVTAINDALNNILTQAAQPGNTTQTNVKIEDLTTLNLTPKNCGTGFIIPNYWLAAINDAIAHTTDNGTSVDTPDEINTILEVYCTLITQAGLPSTERDSNTIKQALIDLNNTINDPNNQIPTETENLNNFIQGATCNETTCNISTIEDLITQ